LQGTAELETLRRTNVELIQGKTKLETLMGRLEKDCVELDKSITVLEEKEAELDKVRISQFKEETQSFCFL